MTNRILAVVLALAAGASAAQAQSIDPTPYAWEFPQVTAVGPGADVMKTELQEQIQAVLNAGHLAPLYISYSDQGSVGYAVYMEPGRILTTLAWAYPYLTAAQQTSVRAYVASELGTAQNAPWGTYPLPNMTGTPRETHPKTKWWSASATFGQHRPSVQTIYGLWLYAYRTGDWTLIQNNWASIKTMYSARSAQANLYGTMGAHVAMARLADKFTDAATRTAAINNLQAQLNAGLNFATIESNCNTGANAPYPDMYDSRMNGSTYHGWMFLNLTPELGRYLRANLLSAVTARHDQGKATFPFWWMGKMSYFNRSWTGDEGTGLLPEVMGMMAPVERWVVQANAATLRGQMASSPTGIGDCYWLEALVQAIEAHGTLAWTDVRTGTTPPPPPPPTTYLLTVTNGNGDGTYAAGTVVTITANAPAAGMVFSTWTGATVANATAATTTLTMPAANTTVTANYVASPPPPPTTYTLTVNSGNGDGTYAAGAVVTITANAPAAGMTFDHWIGATVANPAAATTTITMPAANTTVTATYMATGAPLPAPWGDIDIGTPAIAGDASVVGSQIMVCGAGADIWNTSDSFHFASTALTGDATIVARIVEIDNTDPWAKAGVMIRETLNANSANAFMALSYSNGATFQRRLTTGAATVNTVTAAVAAPYWVKLQRAGNVFTGSISPDGVNWTVIGTDTIAMAAAVYVGIAVTSHNAAALNCATLESIGGSGGWAGATPSAPVGGSGTGGGGGGGGSCGLLGLEAVLALLGCRTCSRSKPSPAGRQPLTGPPLFSRVRPTEAPP